MSTHLRRGMIFVEPLKCKRCGNKTFTMTVRGKKISDNLVVLLDPAEFVQFVAEELGIVTFVLTCCSCGCQCATKEMEEVGMEISR